MTSFKSKAKSHVPYIVGAAGLSIDTLKFLANGITVPWIDLVIGAAAQVVDTAGVSCQRFVTSHEIGALTTQE
jgi:hypothetical protein